MTIVLLDMHGRRQQCWKDHGIETLTLKGKKEVGVKDK